MKQIKKVLQFELSNYFKNKSYLVTTILLTVVLALGLCIPTVLDAVKGDESADTKQEATKDEDLDKLVIYDQAGVIKETEYLTTTYKEYNWELVQSEANVNSQVTEGKAIAGFVIKSPTEFVYVINNTDLYDSKQDMFSDIMSYYYRTNYMQSQGVDVAGMEEAINMNITTSEQILGKDSVNNYAYTYILLMATYLIIILYGQLIATSVTAEKSNRAIEVLITSTKPTALIFGKVFAGVIASIIQVGVILCAGITSYQFNRDAWDGLLDPVLNIPAEVLVSFFLFLIIGFLFYSFLYASLGALVSKTEDISKSIGPVLFIFMIAFFIAIYGLSTPDSTIIKVCSYIPFTSMYCMLIRVAMGTVGLIEIIISLIILIASSIVTGALGAKIYRMGTLHYGNPLKFSTVLKKIIKEKE